MAITLTLIAITGAVSLYALYGNRQLLQAGMLRPYRTVRQQTWYEVISSGFLHAGIVHLVVNMFVLFIFGAIVEEMLGEIHFTALYFSGLVVSALPSLIRHREDPNYATLGASGAVQAVLFALGGMLVYIAFRFEFIAGVAAVLAIIHDTVITVGFFSFFNREINLTVIAALLTLIGYSMNDKIVIFDRVRENLHKYRRQNLYDILNLSINETLPRTVLTGGSTLATALVLAFFAGEIIKPFALVMSFGIIVGTFSSIYVASPLLMHIEQRWPGEDARGARVFGTKPAAAQPATTPRTPQPAR